MSVTTSGSKIKPGNEEKFCNAIPWD